MFKRLKNLIIDRIYPDRWWIDDKADLEQGAYYIADRNCRKISVIFPFDRTLPIEEKNNAWLLTRNYGSDSWAGNRRYPLKSAMTIGLKHARQYQSKMQLDERGVEFDQER